MKTMFSLLTSKAIYIAVVGYGLHLYGLHVQSVLEGVTSAIDAATQIGIGA